MNSLYNFLNQEQTDFAAKLGEKGGYIQFTNSGRRGTPKSFHISLESLYQTLLDIKDNISVFAPLQSYQEHSWRDNGATYFKDEVANATITVQTKPLFCTLSKLVKWANEADYAGVNPDNRIILTHETLEKTLAKLRSVIELYSPAPHEPNAEEAHLQIIYFGAPGCGKSHKVAEAIAGGDKENIFRTTFHPDYDYASFVGCYKPEMEEGEVKYAFTPQVFTKAYVHAWEHPNEKVYLVIEEINRGNCAQIFGDLFQLLDRKDDGTSCYPIRADKDLADYLQHVLNGDAKRGIEGGNLCLPPNLHIIATMNTSDQSLFPMDSAFKRRWDWEYIPINYSDEVKSGQFVITINDKNYKWVTFLKAVNRHIRDLTHSEDKQMGNFFVKNSIEKEAFKSKVMAYLWHEVCKDEYGTQGNFFRSYEEEKKDVKEFSFNELYEEVDYLLLQGFMAYLGVPVIGEENTGEENE
jgi:type II restriction-modification system restriction subunit